MLILLNVKKKEMSKSLSVPAEGKKKVKFKYLYEGGFILTSKQQVAMGKFPPL
jgi:hypothetical protein